MLKRREKRLLFRWITQREQARRNKEAGLPHPYCDDAVINSYRFCNVIRMDDRVSRWLQQNWYRPNLGHQNQWLAAVIARYFNWPETLETIGYPNRWNARRSLSRLAAKANAGEKLFSAAYIIPAPPNSTKYEHVITNVVDNLYNSAPRRRMRNMRNRWRTMEEAHIWLQGYAGFGSFLAGQVVADWRHSGVFSNTPTDVLTWAPIGPGSRRGINRLLGLDVTKPVPMDEAAEIMFHVFMEVIRNVDDPVVERLELMDLQNCLCEFDKYMRTLNGEGRPKVTYVPDRGF